MRARLLGREDDPAIIRLGGPLAVLAEQEPEKLDQTRVLGVETDEGQLVAYWMVFQAVHLEPLYIAAPYQKSAATARALVSGMRDLLRVEQIGLAFAVVEDAENEGMAGRLGLQPVPGRLFFLQVHHGSSSDSDRSSDRRQRWGRGGEQADEPRSFRRKAQHLADAAPELPREAGQ